MNKESSLHRKIRLAPSGSLLILVYLLISPMNAIAQTSIGLLSRLTENQALKYRVSFSFGPGYPAVRQSVQFLDTSSGNPTSWQWNFGDGSTSTEQNPTHEYLKSGFRRVTLVASCGTSSKKAVRTITIMPAPAPASFVFSPETPEAGQTVQFADTSSGDPKTWLWDFGDGTTSIVKNPSHAYSRASSYVATLISSGSSGSKQGTDTITVTATPSPIASFTSSPTSPLVGEAVQFADTSAETPTSWQWNFGDDGTSTSQNPSHLFTAAGSKMVTLTATNASGSNSTNRTVTVVAALAASFTYSPASPAAGQAVQFTDTSVGTPTSWQWNFGDGSTSTAQNPSHAYTTTGSKTATMTVTNASGSNSAIRTVTVVVALASSFTYSPASPAAGQAVQFTDTSTGTPTSWQWNFGDGSTSTIQNPSHSFTTAGSKTVTMTVTNASGSNGTTRTVTVVTALAASFTNSPASPAVGQAVQFTDTSVGTPTSWQWNFGDGISSTAQNPIHSFTTAGSKTVILTVTNASGSNSSSRTVTVVAALAASFTYSPASPAAGQTVQFTDTSAGTPTSWQWDFNDGATSNTRNPSHIFTTAGSFNVTLTVINSSSSNSISRILSIAPTTTLAANFIFNPAAPVLGQLVQFTDTSTGSPTSWQWSFGDGATSTLKSPSHA
ncbi:MAG: PKD domain-containing protein, partial [Candidatus Atribacteria bacterium]|nr:PKD domain-containing protein [Candidatus Atribacteria bacterium]